MGFRKLTTRTTIGIAVGLAFAAPAKGSTLVVDRAQQRDCASAQRAGAQGIAVKRASVAGPALVSARLTEARGNWNLAVFEAATGRLVAASSYASGDEVAQGFTTQARDLIAQACRLSGGDANARLDVEVTELTTPAPAMRLVRVDTPTQAAEDALVSSGLDLTEHGGEGFVDVVLHSPADGAALRDLGLSYGVLDPDLLASSLADREAERRALARGGGGAGLPSGRTGTYRRLADYSEELQALAADNKRLVRYFTLPRETYEGRQVEAIEIAPRVGRKDGRPVFLMMGAHHAREWPSSEHTMEFAYELVNGWRQGRKPIRRLMRGARVIIVPVVNPDGFNTSREAGEALGAAGGRGGIDETLNLVIPYEYHRKNCRTHPPEPEPGGSCDQLILPTGLAQFGVDPNRNYGGFWGGPGASAADSLPYGALAQDYRGPGPFSEPETQNVRMLVSRRQVTTLITNHTFSGLVLRPPGLQAQGPAPDEKVYRRLGAAMARENGYENQRSYQLYDTTGTTEDWSYYATGGLGFTFEIGPSNFHPPFAEGVVAEYRGTTGLAGDGGGNRAAFLEALRSTVNARRHSVIRGTAPRRAFLELTKKFRTPTSPVQSGLGEQGDVMLLKDRLRTTLRVARSGRFRWHVNPSTRPLAAQGHAQVPKGTERWHMTCRARKGGRVLDRRRIKIDRGERVRLNLRRACRS